MEVWSNKILVATEAKLVAAKLVSRYDSDAASEGDVIHVPNLSNFGTARDKSADTSTTLDTVTDTEVQISINKHKYVAFTVEDITAKQSKYDLIGEYTKKAGYAVANAVDTSVLAEYSNFTTTDAGSYEADISAASMVAAIQTLMNNDVPQEDRAFIIHADQAGALLNVQQFVTVDYQGEFGQPTRVQEGPASSHLYGTLYGIPVYYSTNVPTTAGTTTQVHNVLLHREAIGLAMQMAPRVQKQYDIDFLADKVVVDTLYGVKTMRADFGVELRSKKSA